MPVVQKIRLQIVSKEELKDLENDVVFLEGLSRRKETATARVKRRRAGAGGAFGQDPNDISLPSSVLKKRKKEELTRIIKPKGGKLSGELLSGVGAPIQKNVVFKNLQKKVSLLEESQLQTQKIMGTDYPVTEGQKPGRGRAKNKAKATAVTDAPVKKVRGKKKADTVATIAGGSPKRGRGRPKKKVEAEATV